MAEWKRPLLIGLGWGIGTAFGLAVAAGLFFWYASRPTPPTPPKPWNTTAIIADFDSVQIEGAKNTVVFYYTLENKTDFDYRSENNLDMSMNAKLEEQKNIVPLTPYGTIDYPLFVPAKKRVRFPIHLTAYECPVKEPVNPTTEQRRDYRNAVAKYVSDNWSNLDGFDLLDEINRDEIVFPPGWKSKQP